MKQLEFQNSAEIQCVINIVLTTATLSHQRPGLADNVGVTAANTNTSRGIEASGFSTKKTEKEDDLVSAYFSNSIV